MKKLFVGMGLAIVVCLSILLQSVLVSAADTANGANVFKANCSQCHLGGKNLVNPRKTLRKEDLEKYGMYSAEAIIAQVTKGKGAMPAFGRRLKPNQIEDVAAYVLEQADKGWR